MQFKKFQAGTGIGMLCGALFTAGFLAPAAMADPVLPAYTVGGGCTVGPDSLAPDPFCSQSLAGGSDSLSYNLGPVPSLSATASASYDPFSNFGYSAVLSVSYSFEVIGGKPGDVVPLLIATDLTTSNTGDANAYASIGVITSFGNETETYCSIGGAGSPCSSSNFSGTIDATATPGQVDLVYLEVNAGAAFPNDGVTTSPSSAFASADPLIYIDPSFAGAADYQIIVSPGIGNSSSMAAAPEPNTLLLIFVLLPFVLLARRFRAV
jgi:hypothetical protein